MKKSKKPAEQKLLRNDLRLLAQLRADARQPVLALSRGLDLCRITVTKRLQALQKSVIQKYTALLDFQQMGFVRVQLTAVPLEEDHSVFERFIRQHVCLNNLYVTSQGSGYIADLIFQTHADAEHFLSQLDHAFSFAEKNVHFVTKEIVRESYMGVSLCN